MRDSPQLPEGTKAEVWASLEGLGWRWYVPPVGGFGYPVCPACAVLPTLTWPRHTRARSGDGDLVETLIAYSVGGMRTRKLRARAPLTCNLNGLLEILYLGSYCVRDGIET